MTILCLTIIVVSVASYLFFIKYVEYFEYKHCLKCPLKMEDQDINFECFAEDLKKEKEKNEKQLHI